MNIPPTITDQIRAACASSGLTQSQLAAATGISQRAISEFLAGKSIRSDSLDRIAVAFAAELRLPKSPQKIIRNRIK